MLWALAVNVEMLCPYRRIILGPQELFNFWNGRLRQLLVRHVATTVDGLEAAIGKIALQSCSITDGEYAVLLPPDQERFMPYGREARKRTVT